MSLHLWCSSKNIAKDSVHLHLFQITLTDATTKWYVILVTTFHATFDTIATSFLSYFQFLIRHDLGLKILTDFHQNTTTHIADHIHECRWPRVLWKINIQVPFLLDCFLKSLQPTITKDVATYMPQNEEEAILKFQLFWTYIRLIRVFVQCTTRCPLE